jgi:hypothetical protein
MSAAEAVRVLNEHGMVVNTGIIVGFDGERPGIADRIVRMVQASGAFPTLVLPLHALPGTRLAERLEREGRLFGGGTIRLEREDRTDTATTGLNFVTDRPRAEVLRDLMTVLERLYTPERHAERTALVLRQLRASRLHRTPVRRVAAVAKGLGHLVRNVTAQPGSARRFFRAVARATLTNPGALEVVIAQAVMNANYARQARSYVDALGVELAELERLGEARFHAARGAPAAEA